MFFQVVLPARLILPRPLSVTRSESVSAVDNIKESDPSLCMT